MTDNFFLGVILNAFDLRLGEYIWVGRAETAWFGTRRLTNAIACIFAVAAVVCYFVQLPVNVPIFCVCLALVVGEIKEIGRRSTWVAKNLFEPNGASQDMADGESDFSASTNDTSHVFTKNTQTEGGSSELFIADGGFYDYLA